jgi:hypothetical protein
MLPVSDDFTARCGTDHTLVTTVHVLQNDAEVQQLDATLAGSVTRERNVDIRSTIDLQLVDRDGTLTPTSPSHLLAPLGNGIRVRTGVTWDDGRDPELVAVFTGRLGDSGGTWPEVPLKAFDRMRDLARQGFTLPMFIPPGTRYDAAIEQVINGLLPSPDVNFASSDFLVPAGGLTFMEGDNPAQKVREMAQSIGQVIYADTLGVFRMHAEPDPQDAPVVWSFADDDGSVIEDKGVDAPWSDGDSYSVVVCRGENLTNGAVVVGVAEDTDVTSPTYVGRFGRVVYPMTSPYVATNAQAVAAAQARLQLVKGIARKVVLRCLPLPFLDAGDCVHLSYSRSGINANFVIDRLTLPLGAKGGAMELTLRARQELPDQ